MLTSMIYFVRRTIHDVDADEVMVSESATLNRHDFNHFVFGKTQVEIMVVV